MLWKKKNERKENVLIEIKTQDWAEKEVDETKSECKSNDSIEVTIRGGLTAEWERKVEQESPAFVRKCTQKWTTEIDLK